MKTSRVLAFLVLGAMSFLPARGQATTEPDAPSAPTLGPLQGKWEEVDQRFVFLTVDLASTEASITAVNKVLALAGNEQAKQQQRAAGYHQGNAQMDRNGGGPVAWQDFYGQTAQSFYFHPTTTIEIHSRRVDAIAQKTDTPTPIDRPPQLDYIYRANSDAESRAEADVAKLGNKMDQLIQRRQLLEDEQSALWCKIALRALTTREIGDKPLYRFELSSAEKDSAHQQALLAVAAGAKFMRTVNALVVQSQKALDGDQRPVYAKLAETIAHSRADLKTVLLAQPALQTLLDDEQTPLGRFAMAAKRLEDSSENLTDAYGLALDGDKTGDFQRKLNFRGQVQMMTVDFAATVMTADEALRATAESWKISPDVKNRVADETAVIIAPATRPASEEGTAGDDAANQKIPHDGLVLHYLLNRQTAGGDDSPQICKDLSHSGNGGILHDITFRDDPRYGSVAEFNGDTSYIECGNKPALQLSTTFTVAGNVQFTRQGIDDGTLVSKIDWENNQSKGFILRFNNERPDFTLGLNDWQTASSGNAMKLNCWYLVAGTFDGEYVRLYIDGKEVGSKAITGSVPISKYPMLIGSSSFESRKHFTGKMAEIFIYNRALSGSDLKELAAAK